MKRIIACFDGTWNRFSADTPTNVLNTAQAVVKSAPDAKQVVLYSEGVGTGANSIFPWIDKRAGGWFGIGTLKNILRMYMQLIVAYEPGDEIFVFGFSRGAFAARSFVGLIRNCGILRADCLNRYDEAIKIYKSDEHTPDSEVAQNFRDKYAYKSMVSKMDEGRFSAESDTVDYVQIKYLGVWDTVPSLGIINTLDPTKFTYTFQLHDHMLTSLVQSARHAVATDENRTAFRPLPWENTKVLEDKSGNKGLYLQEWFPGDHGSVGGGGDITGLSNIAAKWVWEGAMNQGLIFDQDILDSHVCDIKAPLSNETKVKKGITNWVLSLNKKSRKEKVGLVETSEPINHRRREIPSYIPDAFG